MKNLNITNLALESILYEVLLSPKPGLVDAMDAGSHKDMDIFTFIKSAISLKPGFDAFYELGLHHGGTWVELMEKARIVGMKVEEEMFQATFKINTHKGVVFSMGILLAAIGYDEKKGNLLSSNKHFYTIEDTDRILLHTKEMTKGIVSQDFKNLEEKETLTHGERLYLKYGFKGIRGEAENGYPMLRDLALPKLRAIHNELSLEDQLLEVLLTIMSKSEDSNIVARGGIDALHYVQSSSQLFLSKGGMKNPEAHRKLMEMNEEFKKRNISPGGSADLLSLAIFLGKLEGLIP